MQDYLATVQTHYPSAQTTEKTLNQCLSIIEKNLGLFPPQIALADSLCCDEVNSLQFPSHEMLGPFKMGGLGGYPFAGLTGMGAFSHHIPEEGAALLFYGPHIGISRDGTVGKIKRGGQSEHSGCCGSATGALARFQDKNIKSTDITSPDYQQQMIEQLLLEEGDRLKSADNPVLKTTQILYEAIDRQIEMLASQTPFPCKYLINCGGIFINGDHDAESFWASKRLEILDLQANERTDMQDDLFK